MGFPTLYWEYDLHAVYIHILVSQIFELAMLYAVSLYPMSKPNLLQDVFEISDLDLGSFFLCYLLVEEPIALKRSNGETTFSANLQAERSVRNGTLIPGPIEPMYR